MDRSSMLEWLQNLCPEPLQIHIASGDLHPVLASLLKGQVVVIHVHQGAGKYLLQHTAQTALSAAAAAVNGHNTWFFQYIDLFFQNLAFFFPHILIFTMHSYMCQTMRKGPHTGPSLFLFKGIESLANC